MFAIITDTSTEILAIVTHYFKLFLETAEATDRIPQMKENETIYDRTV